jgi:hypothetical protein
VVGSIHGGVVFLELLLLDCIPFMAGFDRLPKYGTKMAASATAISDSVISVTV